VVFVEDMARYGLHLHLGTGTQIEKISLEPRPPAPFNPEFDEPLAVELGEHEPGVVWICSRISGPSCTPASTPAAIARRSSARPTRSA
jgi:hypothetical protein